MALLVLVLGLAITLLLFAVARRWEQAQPPRALKLATDVLAEHRTWTPAAVLFGGLLLTGSLVGYLSVSAYHAALTAQANERLRQEIAERKRTEAALRASDQRFRALFELAPDPIYLIDLHGTFVDGNRAAAEIAGYAREEFIGKNLAELTLLSPEELKRATARLSQSAKGLSMPPEEFLLRRKDGGQVPVEIRTFPITLEDRRLVLGVARDITERKQSEAALRESEGRYRQVIEFSPDAINIQCEGRFAFVNRATLKLFGATEPKQLIGRPVFDFIHPDYHAIVQERMSFVRQHSEAVPILEEVFLRLDGTPVSVEVAGAPYVFNGQPAALVIARDITDKKLLEKQFLRSQRIESLGTLASGIAHDLNNILAPIMMSAQILQLKEPGQEESEILAAILASAQRGADIVKQVLTFARGVEGQRVCVQPKYLLNEMQRIVQETFPKNITFCSDVPKTLWNLNGDATQLHQVLLNLCVNARDAMPEGGLLLLSAENLQVTETKRDLFGEGKPGPYVLIQVSDTGHGIPRAIVEKIFDPFFTTKEHGKGTGLGLSTALGIVRSHGGFVDVDSEVGRGSTFKIYLPAAPGASASLPAEKPSPPPRGAGQCVLVVDDEAKVRSATELTLTQHGYQVVTAANGEEALGLLASQAHPVQAVVTDIMMPVMDGVALCHALRQSYPQLPVVACTGWGQEGIRAKLKALGVNSFLEKPYAAEALLQLLSERLSEPTQ